LEEGGVDGDAEPGDPQPLIAVAMRGIVRLLVIMLMISAR